MTSTLTPVRLTGNFAPLPDETTATDPPVTGTIPAELTGWYLRNGPNPHTGASTHCFLGDGMVHSVRLEADRAACCRIGHRSVVAAWMDHRKVINGVLWRTRSGCAWRDLPPEYGNWKTVYNRHRRWSGDGTWREVLSGLRVDCDLLDGGEWVLGVDGTAVRAHHHAAGARHEPPKNIPAEVLAPTVLEVSVTPVKSTGGSVE